MKPNALFFLSLLVPLWANPVPEKVNYKGHAVVSVFPTTEKNIQLLHVLEQQGHVKFWKEPSVLNRGVSFQLSYDVYQRIHPIFAREGMNPTILIADLQNAIDELHREIIERRAQNADGREFDFGNYHTYPELVAFMQNSAANNSYVSYANIGSSYYGLEIAQVTVSSGGAAKEIIFLECGIHAREWVAPATCIWIFDQLASGYGVDPEITSLVDRYDWVIVPSTNPDGYEYSWTSDRLWRKNRAPTDSLCEGVDLNRNFDANFGGVGSSALPCSETYHGPEAFSESESIAIRNSLSANAGRIKAYVSVHSYGGLWMSPYGYLSELPVEYDEMYRVMKIGAEAITATYGTPWEYGNEAALLYLTSGTTRDYGYVGQGITFSYTIEARGKAYGFLAPASEILPTAQEIWNGIKAMANAF